MIYVRCRYCKRQLTVASRHLCKEMEENGLNEEVRVSLMQHPQIFASLREVSESDDWMIKPKKTNSS